MVAGLVRRPAPLGGTVGRLVPLGGTVGRPVRLGGTIGRPALLGGTVGRPAPVVGTVGRPTPLVARAHFRLLGPPPCSPPDASRPEPRQITPHPAVRIYCDPLNY